MENELIEKLAQEAKAALVADADENCFNKTAIFAAEYVFFRALRDGCIDDCAANNKKNIRKIERAMK